MERLRREQRIIFEFRNRVAADDVESIYVWFFDDLIAALNKAGSDAEALAIADEILEVIENAKASPYVTARLRGAVVGRLEEDPGTSVTRCFIAAYMGVLPSGTAHRWHGLPGSGRGR